MNVNSFSTQTLDDLTVIQFETATKDTFAYKGPQSAVREQLIKVSEIDDQGSVNHLSVLNDSPFFVFFMDGDILAGAKQNRVVNASILLAPKSKTIIPVSCVEQGRWNHVSKHFSTADHTAPASLREYKSRILAKKMAKPNDFMTDQSGVWQHVAAMKSSTGAFAPTDSLSDVFTHQREAIERLLSEAQPLPSANGLAVFIGDKLVSLDVFHRADVFAEYFPRLLRGVLLDVTARPRQKQQPATDCLARIRSLLATAGSAGHTRPSVGVGSERRFESDELVGFELNYEQHPIHLCLLGKGGSQE